jgi:hypothetical protein
VTDAGTGDLRISANNLRLQNADNTANYIKGNNGSDVELFFNNSAKLATTNTGVDITGTLTSDGLTVDGVFEIFGTSDAFGSTASSAYILKTGSLGTAPFTQTGALLYQPRTSTVDGRSNHLFYTGDPLALRMNIQPTGDISFYEDTGTTPALTWDASAQSLNVDGPITSDGLTVDGDGLFDSDNAKVTVKSFQPKLILDDDSVVGANSDKLIIQSASAQSAGDYEFVLNNDQTSSTDQTAIKISGNGDISFYEDTGTTAKFFWNANLESLQLGSTTSDESSLFAYKNDATYPAITVRQDGSAPIQKWLGASGVERMTIDSSGNVNLTGLSNGTLNFAGGNTSGGSKIQAWNDAGNANGYLAIEGYSSEYMRIDSSGNLFVGTTNGNPTGSHEPGTVITEYGQINVHRDGGNPLRVGSSVDGNLTEYYKQGALVGGIGTGGNRPYFVANDGSTGGGFKVDSTRFYPVDRTGVKSDGVLDLGLSDGRWKDLYLSGGVYLGGTGSANKLDDYEEGTWTANYSATGLTVTHDITTGKYTKVGNLVTFYILVGTDAVSGVGAVQLNITGLPFAPASGVLPSGSIGLAYSFAANENNMKWTIASGGTLNLWDGDSNTAGVFPSNKLATGTNANRLNIIGHYYTA